MTDEQLTRLAAEKVMGWTVVLNEDDMPGGGMDFYEIHYRGGKLCNLHHWKPLAEWRFAGEIADKMRELGWYFQCDVGPKNRARVTFHLGMSVHTGRDKDGSILRAITVAALLAVGAITEAATTPPASERIEG